MTKKGRKKLASRILSFALSIILVGTTFYGDYRVAYADEITVEEAAETPAEVSTEAPVQIEPAQQEVVEATSSDVTVPTEVSEESVVSDESVVSGETVETVVSETISDETAETVETEETLETETEETEETETETETEETEEEPLEFNQSVTVNGILISLYAKPGVLPNDAKLQVSALPQKEEEAIKEAIDEETVKDVEKTYSFDINIYSAEKGGFVQPKDGTVSVTFDAIPEGNSKDTTVEVFHVENNGTDVQKVEPVSGESKTDEITFGAKHFSVYTVTLYKKNNYSLAESFYIYTYDVDSVESIGTDYQTVSLKLDNYGSYANPSQIAPQIDGYKFVKAVAGATYSGWGSTITYFTIRHHKASGWFDDDYDYAEYTTKSNPGKNDWHDVDYSNIYFLYETEDTVAVAVYATDGVRKDTVNPVLAEKLGINYVQGDGYYPVGIIRVPASFFKGKTSPYINSQADLDALKGFLANLDTSTLQGGRNTGNTIASNLQYIQLDVGKLNNQMYTAMFNWNSAEYGNSGSDYGHFVNSTANERGVTIKNPDGGNFKYHLDIRFATNVVNYKGEYFEDNQKKSENPNLDQAAYFRGTAISKETAQAVADAHKGSYTVEGLYTDENLTQKFEGISSLNADATIFVKYEKYNNFTVTYKDGYTDGGEGEVLSSTSVAYGSPTPAQTAPTRDHYDFSGWKATDSATIGVAPTVTKTVTYVAQWTPKQYTITYKDGYKPEGQNVIDSFKADYGANTPKVANPARDFYVFKGWTPAVKTKVEGDAVYTATWEKQYKDTVTISAVTKSKTYDGEALTADYTVTNLPEDFVVTDVTYTGTTTITNAGTANYSISSYKIVDKENNDFTDYFTVNLEKNGTLTVAPLEIRVATGSDTKQFGKIARSYDISINGVAQTLDEDNKASFKPIQGKEETLKFHTTSWRVMPGSQKNEYAVEYENDANKNNYKLVDSLGTLTISTAEVAFQIEAKDQTWTYDGTPKSYDVVSVTKPEGYENFTVEAHVTAASTITEVGTVANAVDRATIKIKDATGADVTANFDTSKIVVKDGTLKVEKRAITVKSGSPSKIYDGLPLQNTDVTIVAGELAPNQKLSDLVSFSNFASITKAGKVANTYSHSETDLAKKNYTITYQNGELEITPVKANVMIKAPTVFKTYDGTALTAAAAVQKTPVSVAGLVAGDEAIVEVSGSVTNVTEGNVPLKIEKVTIRDKETKADVTASYDKDFITAMNGWLYINPVEIYVTTGTASKVYDGTPLTKDDAQVVGLVNNEKATVHTTASLNEVDSIPNTYGEISWGRVNSGNYKHNKDKDQIGTLTITGFANEVTITAGSLSKVYDGSDLTVDSFTVEGLPKEESGSARFTVDVVIKGAQKDVGTSANVVDSYVIKNKEGKDVTANFTNVKKADGTLTVTKRKVTLTSATDSKAYDGTPLTNDTVTESWPESQKYGFVAGEGATFIVTGTVTFVSEGEVDNTFTYTLNDNTKAGNYEITPVFGKLSITAPTQLYGITVTANSGGEMYKGQPQEVSGFTNANLTYTLNGRNYVVSGIEASTEATNAGTYTVEVTGTPKVETAEGNKMVDVTDMFTVTKVPGTLTIGKRTVVMTSATGTKEYDGDPLTAQWLVDNDESVTEKVTVTGDGFVDDEGATYDVTGSQLVEGSSADAFTYTLNEGTLAANYDITTVEGTLTVTNRNAKYEITVKANSLETFYNGKDQTVEGFETLTFKTKDNHTYTVSGLTASATAKDVLKVDGKVQARPVSVLGTPVVKDDQGNDVTNQFKVKTENGTLTIKPRTATLKSDSASKEYDGKPLTNGNVRVMPGEAEGEGFVKDDASKLQFQVTGKQIYVGKSDNTFTYTTSDGFKPDNYNIVKALGELEVTDRRNPYQVTVKANSGERIFNGENFTVEGFVEGYGLTTTQNGVKYRITGISASETQKHVKRTADGKVDSYTVAVTGTPKVEALDGTDVTKQFQVTTEDGTLTINPRTVVLTSDSAEKEYDGTELTAKDVHPNAFNAATGEGFAGDDVDCMIYTVTGTRTKPGTSDNTFSYAMRDSGSAKLSNYNITTEFGKLTVKDRTTPYEVKLHANNLTKFYDRQKATVEGFQASYAGREFAETEKGLSFTENGVTYYITGLTASGQGTDVKRDAEGKVISYPVSVKGKAVVKNAAGTDLTKQFNVTAEDGTLTINPRTVTLRSASASKEYDGTPLEEKSLEFVTAYDAETGAGFAKDDAKLIDEKDNLRLNFTGTQTIVGISDNEFTYSLRDGVKKSNYEITTEYGTLEVTNVNAPYEVTVVANSDEFLYDGKEKSVTGFKEVQFGNDTYAVVDGKLAFTLNGKEFTISGLQVAETTSIDAVEDKPVTITGTAIVTDENGNNVTSQFAVHTENGTLNVTPRKVTLVAGSDEKDFDGKALVKRTYYVANAGDGFATYTKDGVTVNEKTGITVYVKGSQTLVGTSDNVIDRVEFDGQTAKAGNYIVTTEKGTLEVKTREPGNKIKLYIQLDIDQTGKNTKEVLYNGEEQSVSVDVIVNTDGTAEEIETGDEENIEVEEDLTAPAEATEEAGILPVSKADETLLEKVLALGAMKVYAAEDGITKTVTYGGVTFEISGIKLSGGTGIDAGKYPVTIDLSGINVKLSGAPVDDNFEIVIVQPKITELVPAVQLGDAVYIDEEGNEVGGERQEEIVWVEQDVTLDPNVIGMLTINPRNVTLIANSASGVATGQTLTANGYTVGTEDDGFVEGEEAGIKVTVEGAISTVGSVPNKITAYEFDEELAKAGNYIVHTVDGTLTLIAPATVNPPTGGGGGGGGDVLGARRGVEAITPEEGQVLGAARKSPKTSDANNAILWAMVMGSSALGMAAMMAQKRKKEEEQ